MTAVRRIVSTSAYSQWLRQRPRGRAMMMTVVYVVVEEVINRSMLLFGPSSSSHLSRFPRGRGRERRGGEGIEMAMLRLSLDRTWTPSASCDDASPSAVRPSCFSRQNTRENCPGKLLNPLL